MIGQTIHRFFMTKQYYFLGFTERNKMDKCWGKLDAKNHYYYDVPPLCAFKNVCNESTLVGKAWGFTYLGFCWKYETLIAIS